MPAFDPNKFLAETASTPPASDFDPDKFLAQTASAPTPAPEPAAERPWALQAMDPGAIEHAASTAGRSIPIAGPAAVKAGHGLSAFLSSITPDSALPETLRGKTIGELYDHFKTQDDETQAKLMQEYPKAHMVGQALGGAMMGNPLAMEAGAGANLATKIGTGLVNAGTYGELMRGDAAIRGASAEDAEHTGNVVAGIGAAIPGVQALGALGEKVAPAIADFAENRAASAVGMTKAIRRRIGNDAAQQAGRTALDEGVITPFASTEDKLGRAQALQEESGKQIGGVMDQLDQAGIKTFDPLSTVSKVDSEMGSTYKDEPLFSGLANQYDNLLGTIAKRGAQPITFGEAQKLKQLLGQYGYREGMAIPGKEQAQQAYGIVNQALDDAVAAGAKELPNSPGLLDALKAAKSNFQGAKNIVSGLDNKVAAEKGNNFFGLGDTIAGSVAAGAGAMRNGGPGAALAGAAVTAGKKVAAKYGQNTAAWGADKVSKMLQAAPEALGPYAPILREAESRGRLGVAHFVLSEQDPEYQQLLRGVAGSNDDSDDEPETIKTHLPAE